MNKASIVTLGCRLNAYESEVMRNHVETAGLENAVIFNTCAVTGEAVRQAAQAIRKVRREDPGATIIVTGCAAQIEPDRFAQMPEVDFVFGNAEKLRAETFQGLSIDGSPKVQVNDIMSVQETAGQLIDGFGNRARAYVQIQNGCDHRCTFCIIPFGRGPSRSVPAGDVVRQVKRLVDRGFKEVVLTGVDLTSYGADLPGDATLGALVGQILRYVPELKRLRLSSIDQVEVDDALMQAIGNEERLMPHFHLSMQAGSDLILKRMKRRHSRKDAIAFCERVRAIRADAVFGADLIAGFPTETEAHFAETIALADDCGLTFLHVFPFSPRLGTPAARMPQVRGSDIKDRAMRLRKKGNECLQAFLDSQQDLVVDVLLERSDAGRSPQFAEVQIDAELVPGDLVRARITGRQDNRLLAELVD